jgi:hypothetical protein
MISFPSSQFSPEASLSLVADGIERETALHSPRASPRLYGGISGRAAQTDIVIVSYAREACSAHNPRLRLEIDVNGTLKSSIERLTVLRRWNNQE